MKKDFKHIINNAVIFFFITFYVAFSSGCGGEAGTIYPQIISVYPENASTDIPVNTNIVIVFSKPILDTSISGQVSIDNGATIDTTLPAPPDLVSGGNTVILNISSGNLTTSTTYTVTIGTGITDTDGHALSTGGSFSFTTAASTATAQQPRVITASRSPSNGATNVNMTLNYVWVTFTDYVTYDSVVPNPGVPSTWNFNVRDSSSTIVASGPPEGVGDDNPETASVDYQTYRIPINTAALLYGETYTAALTTSICTDAGSFLFNADLTWTFQTVSYQGSGVPTITDIWVSAVTDTTATIKFYTSLPVAMNNCYVVYDTTAGVTSADTHVQESVSTDKTTLHTVTTLATLSPLTHYYFIAGVDTTSDGVVDITSTEIDFYTSTNNSGTVNDELTVAANDQDGLALLQTNGAGCYAFWVDNNADICGQYFSSADGSIQWGAGGTAVSSHANTQNGIVAITDGFARAVVIYNDSNNLYAKMVYDSSGINFTWPGNGAAANLRGIDLGLAIKAGSSYSTCIVHERPDIISSGTTEMPSDGTAANLLYDADVDFTLLGLANNDLLVWNNAGTWTGNVLYNTDSFNLFNYVLRTSAGIGLGSYTYYLADQVVITTGTADAGTNATTLISNTDANFLLVAGGDIIYDATNGGWGIAGAAGVWVPAGPYYSITIAGAGIATLASGVTYNIYPRLGGPFTSEAVANPLWDTLPVPLFNPGVNVQIGDYIVNEGTTPATYATITAITAADTNYALQLSADIMDNADIYAILRLPSVHITFKGVGFNTDGGVNNFQLRDTNAAFVAWPVNPGDIVFNIDSTISAMVLTRDSGTQLTLSADIFNGATEKYIIYTKRAFLVTYIDGSNYVVARAFNIETGAALDSAFNVCTDGTNANPMAVSDESGNAIIFYEKSSNIYAKKISAKGEFFTAWGVNADQASDVGRTILAGYTIVQALPDGVINSTGGAYLLAKNTAGTAFRLVHIPGGTGVPAIIDTVNPGYDPQMAIDKVSGENYNRVIIVYRNINVIYYYIQARAYRNNAANWGPVNVTSSADSWNRLQPSITMADNTTGADYFYVAWFDGKYFNPSGYSIFGQLYTGGGAAQWAAGGVFISTPTSMGYDYTLYMRLLYWNDGGTPYGLMPIWLDYRNYATTGTDIYYEQITAP
jgi:hypothetical protein